MRTKKITRVTAFIVTLTATAAFAAFLATFLGEGSFTGTTGKGTEVVTTPITLSYESGVLSPGQTIPVSISVNNPSSQTAVYHRLETGLTTNSGACPPSEFGFHVETKNEEGIASKMSHGEAGTLSLPPGTSTSLESGAHESLSMKAGAGPACEGVAVTITEKLSS